MNKLVKNRNTTSEPASPKRNPFTAESGAVMSRTMKEALGTVSKPTLDHHNSAPAVSSSSAVMTWNWSSVLPKSRNEQYWASRALTAETLLTARTEHQWEMRDLTRYQEERRAIEVAALSKAHDERLSKLEKLIIILIGVLVLFAGALFFVYVTSAPINPRNDPRAKSYAHFTIPILSPFASVVRFPILCYTHLI
ncbi:hypothetical protein VNI00_002575 [Paramarasmius palmivorus]|uniref:Uncharacterized protein n=1 Tax=Paramarasmius palmivorus TaxID=297713 RepID=A0AAW0DZC3_9AGAR